MALGHESAVGFAAHSAYRKAAAFVAGAATALALAPAAMANYTPNQRQDHPGALGARKVAALLVNFRDDPIEPFTAEQAKTDLFTGPASMNAYFQTSSFGQFSLRGKYDTTGDVYDWVTVPNYLKRDCDEWGMVELGKAANKAAERATGKKLTGYDNYIYMFPRQQNCKNENNGRVLNGQSLGNANFINSRNNTINIGVNIHEFGHAIGLSHANVTRCARNGQRLSVPLMGGAACRTTIYGDELDPMGYGAIAKGQPVDFSAHNKAKMGWFKPNNIRTVTHDATVTIAPLETASDSAQLIRIPYGTLPYTEKEAYAIHDEQRFVEIDYRQPAGMDSNFAPTDPMFHGVTIRESGPLYRDMPISLLDYTRLIDTTPETFTPADAPLAAGRTYHDPKAGVAITTLSTGPEGASIHIDISPKPPTQHTPDLPVSRVASTHAGLGGVD